MKENCELLMKAKILASKRGLDSSQIDCPIIKTCTGNSCIYLSDIDKLEAEQEIKKNGPVPPTKVNQPT
jgi:hypothetical protein